MSSPNVPAVASPESSHHDGVAAHFGFENTYARLPERFYARLDPTPVAAPRLIKVNAELARNLGLNPDALASSQGVEILAGSRVPEGAEPLAIAYAGHQFGHFVPQLGDGRANLLGEVMGRDGVRYDIQLKGSGPTPFFAPWRWPCGPRSGSARVHCERSDGGTGRANHPRPGCGNHRGAGSA